MSRAQLKGTSRAVGSRPPTTNYDLPATRRASRGGFTLIEILVVIVIVTILAGIVIGAAKYVQVKEARARAQSQIAMMETALESYKNDNGAYPLSTAIRANSIGNSILLYWALAAGPKQYMTFKPNQLRDFHDSIALAIGCDTTNSVGPYVILMDPFGQPYNYFRKAAAACGTDGQTNIATFDLWSYGPNNVNDEGTNDDITNWKQN